MRHIKSINEHKDIDIGFDFKNFDWLSDDESKKKQKIIINAAKNGHLYKYLESGQTQLTFGMLRDLHKEAIEFKERREYKQGVYKFLVRAVPLALAPVFFPVWLIGRILGTARALNKILVPVLKLNNHRYNDFIENLILKVVDVTEGEFERLLVDDWFYKSFAVQRGLILMTRKETIVDFAYYISKKMDYADDNAIVPPYYVENEFRTYLNKKFELDPQLPLKKPTSKPRELSHDEKRMVRK